MQEDRPTRELEEAIVDLTGKEAALFMPSGTMSNQIALLLHSQQMPAAVLCEKHAHVHQYEVGGIAFHARATVQAVQAQNLHHLTLEDVEQNAQLQPDVHFALTRTISLENTLHGMIMPQDEVRRIAAYAQANKLNLHLDGARLWNVAAETGQSIAELCAPFDSVSLCLSKGLGAPVGSVLCGSKEFISRALVTRKLFGGGMHQSGVIAAAAHVALHDNFPKLKGTHELARKAAKMLAELGVPTLLPVETNMVRVAWRQD